MPKKLSDDQVTSYPLELYRGMTYSRTFQYSNSDGTPIDLTGKSIVVHIRNVFPTLLVLDSDAAPTALGSEVVMVDAVDGRFRLKLTDEETLTAELTTSSSEARWWIELHDGGDVILLWKDCVTVEDI